LGSSLVHAGLRQRFDNSRQHNNYNVTTNALVARMGTVDLRRILSTFTGATTTITSHHQNRTTNRIKAQETDYVSWVITTTIKNHYTLPPSTPAAATAATATALHHTPVTPPPSAPAVAAPPATAATAAPATAGCRQQHEHRSRKVAMTMYTGTTSTTSCNCDCHVTNFKRQPLQPCTVVQPRTTTATSRRQP